MTFEDKNVALALALSVGAAASTAIGASVVFFSPIVDLMSKKKMASSFGFSAGIMLFISFVTLLPRAIEKIKNTQYDKRNAFFYTIVSFFAGSVLPIVINFFFHRLVFSHDDRGEEKLHIHSFPGKKHKRRQSAAQRIKPSDNQAQRSKKSTDKKHQIPLRPPCCQADTVNHLENCKDMFLEAETEKKRQKEKKKEKEEKKRHDDEEKAQMGQLEWIKKKLHEADSNQETGKNTCEHSWVKENAQDRNVSDNIETLDMLSDDEESGISNPDIQIMGDSDSISSIEQHRLYVTHLKLALAIAMHNFPEGMITFSTVVIDPKAGALLAFGVALHNIPEGFCVSLPAYFSTRNRFSAFLWGTLAGLFEPLGAIVAWVILSNSNIGDLTEGIIDAFVAGIMTMIALKELVTTAHRYDPHDSIVTISIFAGMLIMAISIVLTDDG